MKSASGLMRNTLLLTGSSIALRLCALCFQAYLATKIGAEQLGLFGIITSVGSVFATIAVSGVRFSVTRLTAEELSYGGGYPCRLMRCAFIYALFFGSIASLGMYLPADILSKAYIGSEEASAAVKIMALAMPAIGIGAVAEGYFTARQKISRLVIMQITTQTVRTAFAVVMMSFITEKRIHPADILASSFFVGEVLYSAGLLVLCLLERKTKNTSCFPPGKLIKTALPLAVSAYMRTGLSSVGQVIIPSGLKKSGMTGERALATYGVITQMALPVIMFPIALLQAMADMLVPRLTEAQTRGEVLSVCYMVSRSLRLGILFCTMVSGAMFFFSEELGVLIYRSNEAGLYIKTFAPLVPIIYIDAVTDGCLKGLGEQVYSMALNVAEGVLNVVLLFIFLPKGAIGAYIVIMYIKEGLNTFLSLRRLTEVTNVRLEYKTTVTVSLCAVAAWISTEIVSPGNTVIKIMFYIIFYVAMLYVSDSVTRNDIKWTVSLFFNNKKAG